METRPAPAETQSSVREAAGLIRSAHYLTAFTGAGISVESGIPSFRGPGGLWSQYDSRMLELDYFLAHSEKAWPVIREIFYDHFGKARPNRAHEVLAAWEARGLLKTLITQNIDNLHHIAGSERLLRQNQRAPSGLKSFLILTTSRRAEARK
jgi:NAD-dependent deacetylase